MTSTRINHNQSSEEKPVVKLTASEKKALERVKKKMELMNEDLMNSRGLSRKEIEAAVKAGLIDPDQAYLWSEEWQKGERVVKKKETRERRVSHEFDDIDSF